MIKFFKKKHKLQKDFGKVCIENSDIEFGSSWKLKPTKNHGLKTERK